MSDEVFDLGDPPVRLAVDASLVRRLVDSQFPQWAGLPVSPVVKGGWDNHTFHLGDDLIVRLPSAAEYAEAVDKEIVWLPRLAEHLSLPIPHRVAVGEPDATYPFRWSVQRWIEGSTATRSRIVDLSQFAADLADFMGALRGIDATDGPRPGLHNWYRGGPLRTFDGLATRALPRLADLVDEAAVASIWTEALATPWDGVDRWFHGDLASGNLLVDENGRLSAVIDFGTCGVGDPSCDLAVAWTILDASGRTLLRERLGIDDDTWVRGRGWALWKALSTAAGCRDEASSAVEFNDSLRVVQEIVADAG